MMMARNLGKILHVELGRRAVSSLEYAMIAMLVAVASVGAVSSASTHISSSFTQVASGL